MTAQQSYVNFVEFQNNINFIENKESRTFMNLFPIFTASRFSGKLIAGVFLSISLLSSCGGNGGDPPPWKICEDTFTKSNPANTDAPTTDHLVVYLDTSASMAGYVSPDGGKIFAVSPDGQTIFSKTLLELRSIVTTLSPQPEIVFRRVDANVSEPSINNDLDLSKAALNRATYNGKETNIAGAIKNFNQPIIKTDEEKKKPPRFHILVTDGVQSSNKQNTDTSCAQGSDSFCVKKQILELLNNGWSATVFGLKGEFQGNVYSEINNSVIPFASGKDANKFRPFYLYIFSPDKNALAKMTETLRQRLGGIVKSEEALREFALTSAYSNGIPTIELQNPSKDFIDLKQEKEKQGNQPRITIYADVATDSKGAKPLLLKVKIPWSESVKLGGNPNELLSLVKWTLEPIGGGAEKANLRYPSLKLVKQEIKDGAAELNFEAGWTREAGDLSWRMYRLVGRLDTDKPVLPWVSQWSTQVDTTADVANKTLNVESSLGNLWKNKALENEYIGSACIRVGTQ